MYEFLTAQIFGLPAQFTLSRGNLGFAFRQYPSRLRSGQRHPRREARAESHGSRLPHSRQPDCLRTARGTWQFGARSSASCPIPEKDCPFLDTPGIKLATSKGSVMGPGVERPFASDEVSRIVQAMTLEECQKPGQRPGVWEDNRWLRSRHVIRFVFF